MKRVDGIRVKDEVPIYYLIPQFLPHRYDAMNMTTVDIPVEPLKNFMNAKRREGRPVSHMALVMAAYVRIVAEYPSVNRFIVNRKIYQHNDLTVSLVVLRPGGGNDDTMGKLKFEPTDTVFDIQRKIDEFVEQNASGEEENGLDKIMRVFCNMSGLMRFIVGVLRFMDAHGMLPRFLVDVSPFHASLLVSNLASIRANHIFHHVYDFGTTSVSITMGNMREVPKRGPGETTELVRCLPLGVVMDERIASGHYLTCAFARFRELLAEPELLESPNGKSEEPKEEKAAAV